MFIYKLVNKRLNLKGLYSLKRLVEWYNDYYKQNEDDVVVVYDKIKEDSDFEIEKLGFFDCVEVL